MKKLILLTILSLLLFTSIATAENVTPGVNMMAEKSGLNDIMLIGGTLEMELENDIIIDGYLGTGIEDGDQYIAEISLIKKFLADKNYYFGLAYKHAYDDNTDGGAEITRNIMYAKFVGKNSVNGYNLTTDISLSPYAVYSIGDGDSESMDSYYISLEIERRISDALSFAFTAKRGNDEYTTDLDSYGIDISHSVTSYTFGLKFDM
ncbi:MAG: hypothetical protein ACLFPF_08280 [Halanaerobiales bacterium]